VSSTLPLKYQLLSGGSDTVLARKGHAIHKTDTGRCSAMLTRLQQYLLSMRSVPTEKPCCQHACLIMVRMPEPQAGPLTLQAAFNSRSL
jgi:hypothetical protein